MLKKFWKDFSWENFWLTFAALLLIIGVGGSFIVMFPAMLWIFAILLGFGALTILVMFLSWWIEQRKMKKN